MSVHKNIKEIFNLPEPFRSASSEELSEFFQILRQNEFPHSDEVDPFLFFSVLNKINRFLIQSRQGRNVRMARIVPFSTVNVNFTINQALNLVLRPLEKDETVDSKYYSRTSNSFNYLYIDKINKKSLSRYWHSMYKEKYFCSVERVPEILRGVKEKLFIGSRKNRVSEDSISIARYSTLLEYNFENTRITDNQIGLFFCPKEFYRNKLADID